MRAVAPLVAVVSIVGGAVHATVLAQADRSGAVLAEARAALGGEARIAQVRTLVASGRTRQLRGDNLVPIEFEIQIELPDKYSRRDEIPAQDTGPTTLGFNGDVLVQIPAAPPPGARGGAPPGPARQEAARRERLETIKHDVARLMLGLFASGFGSMPLAFSYAGQAEAPQGKADVISVSGPSNFAARFFIDGQTHLPIMVSWQAAAAPARRGGPPPADAPIVEQRMYFADYRSVDALRLPFRIRRAAGADTFEETIFDRFRINAQTDPRRFEPGK